MGVAATFDGSSIVVNLSMLLIMCWINDLLGLLFGSFQVRYARAATLTGAADFDREEVHSRHLPRLLNVPEGR